MLAVDARFGDSGASEIERLFFTLGSIYRCIDKFIYWGDCNSNMQSLSLCQKFHWSYWLSQHCTSLLPNISESRANSITQGAAQQKNLD